MYRAVTGRKPAKTGTPLLGFSLPIKESAERFERPDFSSAVRACFPSPDDDNIKSRLDLNDLVQHKKATYYACGNKTASRVCCRRTRTIRLFRSVRMSGPRFGASSMEAYSAYS